MTGFRFASAVLICLGAIAAPASAEIVLSFYSGLQTAPHSRVRGNDPGGVGAFSFLAAWEGRSFRMPPYYGIRGTWWRTDTLGFGLDYSHNKVYADNATLAASGFSHLEFTDGLNTLTANVWRRWPGAMGRWTPYLGAGAGVSVPHVEATSTGGRTFEYQLTGPAFEWVAGVQYAISDRWGIFAEYKGTYSVNNADLSNGGTLSTNIVTNALNLGVSLRF